MTINQHLRRIARIPSRFLFAFSYYGRKLRSLVSWSLFSREDTNLTYELTDDNLDYLAHSVALVTGCPFEKARAYIEEARTDEALKAHVLERTRLSEYRLRADERCHFGRRLGWYAFVRVMRPKCVVETGVDKGHGAVLLCAALLRNEAEGFPGRYVGTDINPQAGLLLAPPYNRAGQILYGDSIESLKALPSKVDLFINDSDHSADYEYAEYLTIRPLLAAGGIILGDNAHATSKLARFSRETGRDFAFFREVPKDHWYPGAGIGISFKRTGPGDASGVPAGQ